jgi:uncharacterized protein YaaW (UPF0174 family)
MKNPIFDKNLTPLLRGCTNLELDSIVEIILTAPSQTLTVQGAYREHAGDHHSYVDEIVYEITSFGGNTLANLVRGRGVPYAELVRNVATELNLPPTFTDTTATLEMKIIIRVLKLTYDKLSPEDRIALQDILAVDDDPAGEIDFSEGFPEREISNRLASAGTALLGDRIGHAVETAAASTRVRRTLLGFIRSGVTKIATAGLGGPISWTLAIGEALAHLFAPNMTIALALITQVGLLRQENAHAELDNADEDVALDG